MAYVIIGASGGLGRALADRLAADGRKLVLVARDPDALSALAGALRDRHGVEAATVAADVAQGAGYLDEVARAARAAGGIEGLLMPIGFAVRDGIGTTPETMRELGGVNFFAPADAVAKLWPDLVAGEATIVGFGSITAARGRGRNFVYGAMKRALLSYFESLRLAARGTPVRVQFWVPGFLDTDAMKSENTPLPKAEPRQLAERVVARLGHDTGIKYFPRYWYWVTLVLRLLPWRLYARLGGKN